MVMEGIIRSLENEELEKDMQLYIMFEYINLLKPWMGGWNIKWSFKKLLWKFLKFIKLCELLKEKREKLKTLDF